mmetsp:Transcript_2491/g.9143  ORF Transcript_2491/g.9143 Transcript_2491/m.9143 type:complete len:235 (-) Transcript_2491:61-765(-)
MVGEVLLVAVEDHLAVLGAVVVEDALQVQLVLDWPDRFPVVYDLVHAESVHLDVRGALQADDLLAGGRMPVPRDRVPDLLLAVIVPLPAPQVAVLNPVVHRGVVQELRLLLDVLPRLLKVLVHLFPPLSLLPRFHFGLEGLDDGIVHVLVHLAGVSPVLAPVVGRRLGRVHGGSHVVPLHRLRREGPLRLLVAMGGLLLADLAQKALQELRVTQLVVGQVALGKGFCLRRCFRS